MIYDENDLLMLSALQHILFCERQCALIHIEQQWQENVFTVRGQDMHSRVDDNKKSHLAKDIKIEYGMHIRSLKLGLIGKCDAVEFHKKNNSYHPYPIEYKLGKPKKKQCDEVQLCAQALCMEEMLDITIPEGALFYGKTRRRKEIKFDCELRNLTIKTAENLHKLISSGITPDAEYTKQCDNCSLKELCMPKLSNKSIKKYIERMTNEEVT